VYSVISVKLDSLRGNTKKQGIDPFVADQSAISPSLVGPQRVAYPRGGASLRGPEGRIWPDDF